MQTCTELIEKSTKAGTNFLAPPVLTDAVILPGSQFASAVEEMTSEHVLESQFQSAGWKAVRAVNAEISVSRSFEDGMLCTRATSLLSSVLKDRYQYLFAQPKRAQEVLTASHVHVVACLDEFRKELKEPVSIKTSCTASAERLLTVLQQENHIK